MRATPSCIRVFVRATAAVRPGETPDEAIERLLPQAVEELKAKAEACGLLPGPSQVDHHLEVETCRVDDDEVEVRVTLYDAAARSGGASSTRVPFRTRESA
jgi:hypothetical protein